MISTNSGGTFDLASATPIHRMGFGAMRLTGPGVWGPPADEGLARSIVRRAVELGVNLIDTADVYGPEHSERIIREALYPYPTGLVIATKGGLVRKGSSASGRPLRMNGSEYHLRRAVERSLQLLRLESIDLYQLHRIDPDIPVEETMGIFRALRDEGKIRHVGLSEVSLDELARAQTEVEIASVQSLYNLGTRKNLPMLRHCEAAGIGFMPWYPLHLGAATNSPVLAEIVGRTGYTKAQVALAWMLAHSRAMLLIPGTSSIAHLEENISACEVALSESDMMSLDSIVDGSTSEATYEALTSAGTGGRSEAAPGGLSQ